jgi:tetratricopeptide (TPR) repeat protein
MESIVAQAADEYLEQLARGETPDLSEYAVRYPQVASVLPQVLPVLRIIQNLAPLDKPGESLVDVPGMLGDFRLIREIGRGGMGAVYEAEQVSLGRRVALKVLVFSSGAHARQVARFQIEAQVAAALHHPHIVPIFAVGCECGVHFYAMQLIDGRCLAAILAEQRRHADDRSADETAATEGNGAVRMNAREAARLGIHAAEALEHAHALGVLHRDVKPANLLVDSSGHLWVTDFGLARCHNAGDLTASGDLPGTARYMSPEQAGGGRILDGRTDVYSLGATLYEIVTGRAAFDGDDRTSLIRRIAYDEPIAPRKLDPTIPRDLETIIGKAMAKEPEQRYTTANELALDLRRFCEDRPIQARRPGIAGRLARWSRRHRTATVAATAAVMLIALGCAIGMTLLWQAQRRTLAAFETARAARARERQALVFAFSASDQIAEKALARLAESASAAPDSAGDSPEAAQDREFCRTALVYYDRIASDYRDDASMRAITAATFHRIGFIRTILREPRAREAFLESIALYERLIASEPDNEKLRCEQATTHSDLLILERKSGRDVESARLLEKVVALRQAILNDFPANKNNAISLTYFQIELCEQLAARGRTKEGLQLFERIRANARRSLGEGWNNARLCSNLAWLLARSPRSPEADVALAVALAGKAVELAPKCATFWNTLGVAQYRICEWETAQKSLNESMRLRDGGDANDWLFVAMVQHRLGHRADARGWYERSLKSLQTGAASHQQLARFRAEAESLLGLTARKAPQKSAGCSK